MAAGFPVPIPVTIIPGLHARIPKALVVSPTASLHAFAETIKTIVDHPVILAGLLVTMVALRQSEQAEVVRTSVARAEVFAFVLPASCLNGLWGAFPAGHGLFRSR